MRKNTNIINHFPYYSEIVTVKGEHITVSPMDIVTVSKHSWYVTNRGYAATKIDGKLVYMHRMLLNPPKGMQVDHRDQNKLNNCRDNLRIVTNQQNHFNKPLNSNNSSGVTGVYWNSQCQKWCVNITINGKTIHGGLFDDIQDATKKRKKLEEIYYK